MTPDSSNRGRLLTFWSIAVAFQVILGLLAVRFPASFGYNSKSLVFEDVKLYYKVARPILAGQLPYRDYSIEYPVLAIPLFAAPLVFGDDFVIYRYAFAGEMLLFGALATWMVARAVEESEGIGKVPERLAWFSLCFAILCPMIVVRFDLAPMFLAFASARWLAKGRVVGGGVLAGLGVLVKLVPGLVIVPFLAMRGSLESKTKAVVALAFTVALGGLAWYCLEGEQIIRAFLYHGERGLEIGSLYSSAYLVAHLVAKVWVFSHFDHGSMNVSGPGAADAARLSPIVQLALLALVAGRAREAPKGQEMRFVAAALLAYIVAGKVLSPQYLIWLIPFLCATSGTVGTRARWVFLASCVLTTALYPHLFHTLSYFEPLPVVVLAARNLSLVCLFAILLGREATAVGEGRIIAKGRTSEAVTGGNDHEIENPTPSTRELNPV